MRRALTVILTAGLFSFYAWGQSNACDLTGDGRVDDSDVDVAIDMALGKATCNANVFGAGVCNVVVVQRVINARSGGTCVTGTGTVAHSVALNWAASTSSGVTGYKVYRGTASGGPYTAIATLGVATTYTDATVQSGQTYYYVVTAMGSSESGYSNQAQAVVPIP